MQMRYTEITLKGDSSEHSAVAQMVFKAIHALNCQMDEGGTPELKVVATPLRYEGSLGLLDGLLISCRPDSPFALSSLPSALTSSGALKVSEYSEVINESTPVYKIKRSQWKGSAYWRRTALYLVNKAEGKEKKRFYYEELASSYKAMFDKLIRDNAARVNKKELLFNRKKQAPVPAYTWFKGSSEGSRLAPFVWDIQKQDPDSSGSVFETLGTLGLGLTPIPKRYSAQKVGSGNKFLAIVL